MILIMSALSLFASRNPHQNMRAYITEQAELKKDFLDDSKVMHLWEEPDITYDWNGSNFRNSTINVTVTPAMLSNRSVFAHVFFTREGFSPDPRDGGKGPGTNRFSAEAVIYKRVELTVHRAPLKVWMMHLLHLCCALLCSDLLCWAL